MADNYSKCEKGYNKQLASGFIAYMMAGSLFQKCFCAHENEAQHLYLHYKGMTQKQQLLQEDQMLKLISQLNPTFLSAIQQLQCEVRFEKVHCNYIIRFYTGGFEGLSISIDKNGIFHVYTN